MVPAKTPKAKKPASKKPAVVKKKPEPKAGPPQTKGVEKDFPIDMILRDHMAYQMRDPSAPGMKAGVVAFHVEDIRQAVKARQPVQRVRVWTVAGKGNVLTNGFHTVEAYALEGRKTVPALVFEGEEWQAKLDATQANKDHDAGPLKRTNDDKRRAVLETLLLDREKGLRWSNNKIAEHTGTSGDLVATMRMRLPKLEGEEKKTVGRDGKERKNPTPKKTAPKPAAAPTIASEEKDADGFPLTYTDPPKPAEATPTPTATLAPSQRFDTKRFDADWGATYREIDILGNAFGVNHVPRIENLRRLCREFRDEFGAVLADLIAKAEAKVKK